MSLNLAVVVVVALVATACGEGETASENSLEGSRWEMTAVWDGFELTGAEPTTIATLVFSAGTASGSDGCNRYEVSYSVDGDAVSFGDLVQTGFACDPAHVDQGEAFGRAVTAAARFSASADALELADTGGVTQLVFRRATELPLAGVSWQLMSYGGGTAPIDGAPISVGFSDDGTLRGNSGCNSYFGDYQVDGSRLTVGPLARTEMTCLEPDGVMSQEDDYLNVISQANAFTTTLTGLELQDADETLIAEYRFGGRVRDPVEPA